MRTNRLPWRKHALIILAYGLLALAFTWPLVAHWTTHVPGNGVDDPPLTWNLWWVQHALLRLGVNPFDCSYLFYPLGINLAFYTLTLLNGLLSIPLQASFGLIPASNLLLFSSFVLGGYGSFLLACALLRAARDRSPTGDIPIPNGLLVAAFAAGLLYAFSSNKMAYAALGQWNIASSQWIPFFVLSLFKIGAHPRRRRHVLLAALFLLFQAYAELTYATFLALFTALWLVWQGAAHLKRQTSGRSCGQEPVELRYLAGDLAWMGLLVAIGLIPILAMMIPDMLAEGDFLVEGTGFADVFSADLVGYLVPTMYHPVFGFLVKRFSFHHSVGQHIYLGYSVLGIAALGVAYGWGHRLRAGHAGGIQRCAEDGGRGSRGWAGFWVLSTLVFWLFTLGPTLQVNGHNTGIPLPFALVAQIPFFEGNRYPSRYSVMLTLSVAMLVAFGLAGLLERWRVRFRLTQRGLTVPHRGLRRILTEYRFLGGVLLLAALMLFEHLSVPLPLSDMRVPSIYRQLEQRAPADTTLLDLPVAWRNGFRVVGTQHPIIMFEQYYQTVHNRQVLAGNTSRNPPLKFQYFVEAPVVNTLIALETGHQVDATVVEQDRRLASDVLRFFNVATLVVHPKQVGPWIVPYIETTMPVARFYEDAEIVAYLVDLPPWPGTWLVQPGDPLGRLSYAEGWGVPSNGLIWAQRRAARLLVPMDGATHQMSFRAFAATEDQLLRAEANGHALPWIQMVPGWSDYQVTLPAEAVHQGLNEVLLRFRGLSPVSQARVSPRAIGQTGVQSPVNLVVQSAGLEVGDFGHIYVNGLDVSPNQRGYNIVVLHPKSGDVVLSAAFDTHMEVGASTALVNVLASVPTGYIVAVAAADEASRLLSQEAVTALQGIGAGGDLRGKFRWGHAILGVQGSAPGTALEAMDWIRPVTLAVGEGATEPEVAAALSTITFNATTNPPLPVPDHSPAPP